MVLNFRYKSIRVLELGSTAYNNGAQLVPECEMVWVSEMLVNARLQLVSVGYPR